MAAKILDPKSPVSAQTGLGDPYTGITSAIKTFFTTPGQTVELVSAQNWTKVTLRLESAGPVAIGSVANLRPVGSGVGRLLPANEDVEIVLVPLTRLFIAADSFQRIGVQIEPYPWLFEITKAVKTLPPVLASMLGKVLVSAFGRGR